MFNLEETIEFKISSDTSLPEDIISLKLFAKSSFSRIFFLSISPVDKCEILKYLDIIFAWVPFPAPGGPKKIILFNFIFYLLTLSS